MIYIYIYIYIYIFQIFNQHFYMIVFCSTAFIKKGFLRNLLKLDPRIFIITASRK